MRKALQSYRIHMKARSIFMVVPVLLLAACGPAAWTGYAEYLPADRRTEEAVASASIRELVADLPPGKALEPDRESLTKRVQNAHVSGKGAATGLTLPAAAYAPQRDFEMIQHSGIPLLEMHIRRDGGTVETHVFQRHRTYWHHWIQS